MANELSYTTNVAGAKAAPRKLNRRERKLLQTVSYGQLGLQVAQASIDFATAGNRTAADHGTGVSLPAGAIVVGSSVKVSANLDAASHTATLQFFLGASSDAKAVSSSITADGSTTQDWTINTGVGASISAAKEVTLKVGTEAVTSTSGIISITLLYIVP